MCFHHSLWKLHNGNYSGLRMEEQAGKNLGLSIKLEDHHSPWEKIQEGCQPGHSMFPSYPYNLISPSPQVSLGGGHNWLSSKSTTWIYFLTPSPLGIIVVSYNIHREHSHLLNFQSVCTSLLSTLYKEQDCGLLPVYMLLMCHKDSILVPTWACGCPVQRLHFLSSFVASCGYVINCS